MGFINGSIRVLYIKKVDSFYPIGCLTSNSFSEDIEMIGSTQSGAANGWVSSRPTNQGYNISFDGLIDSDSELLGHVTYQDLRDFKRGRTLIDWRIIDNGLFNYEYGSGYIKGLGDSANIDEFVSFNGNIEGFGEVLQGELNVLLLEDSTFFLQEDNEFITLE